LVESRDGRTTTIVASAVWVVERLGGLSERDSWAREVQRVSASLQFAGHLLQSSTSPTARWIGHEALLLSDGVIGATPADAQKTTGICRQLLCHTEAAKIAQDVLTQVSLAREVHDDPDHLVFDAHSFLSM